MLKPPFSQDFPVFPQVPPLKPTSSASTRPRPLELPRFPVAGPWPRRCCNGRKKSFGFGQRWYWIYSICGMLLLLSLYCYIKPWYFHGIKPLSLYYYYLHVWYIYLHLGDFPVYHIFYYNPYNDMYNLVMEHSHGLIHHF